MLGAVVVPLLIGMLGKDWQTVNIFGMDVPLELLVALGLFAGGLSAHYFGVPWSPLILLAFVGSVAAGAGKLSRALGDNLAPAAAA